MSLKRIHKATLIPGDGIGPAVCEAAVSVMEAAGALIQWDVVQAGLTAIETHQTPIPENVLESIRRTKVALKGPITTPIGEGYPSVNVAIRREFDLFANVRPCASLPGIRTWHADINIVTFRENTEGVYSGQELYVDPVHSAAVMIAFNTRAAMMRICRHAFEWASEHGRKKVTGVHKANILKKFGGIFLQCFRETAKDFPDIIAEEKIVDAVCMELVTKPERFDVIVTTNMFGDIISDLTAGLVGGLGVAPGGNYGPDHAVFEAVHGTAPDIVGRNIANPTSVILSGTMMLHYLGEDSAADRIEKAVHAVFGEGKYLTPDIRRDSKYGTTDFTKAVIDHLV